MSRSRAWEWIRGIFRAPTFEEDEELTRTAKILSSLLNQLTIIIVLVTVLGLPFMYAYKLGSVLTLSLLWAVLIGSLALMHRGRVRAGSALLVVSLWFVFAGLVVLTGGLYSINNVFFLSFMVLAGLLLGAQAAVIVAAASTAVVGTLVAAHAVGIELPQPFPAPPLSRWMQFTIGLLLTITPLNLALRNLAEALRSARDQLRERQRANEALLREKEFSDALVDGLPGIFAMLDQSGKLLRWNRGLARVTAFDNERLDDMTADQLFDTETARDLLDRIDARDSRDHLQREARLQVSDGEDLPYFLSAWPRYLDDHAYLIVVGIDISERIRLEQQLMQSQKMESVGRLAGGIAHDFNNLLTGIIGNVSMAMMKSEAGSAVQERLVDIDRAADSAAQLTRQLLAFSRQQIVKPSVIDINVLLRGIPRLIGQLLSENITIDMNIPREPGVVKLDPSQAEQIIVNFAVNARDAMPSGGRLTIKSRNIVVEPSGRTVSDELEPGDYVMVSVTDTGEGISPEDLEHIFEPFFTTKPEGKGTGLGLATVYGLAAQNGGLVDVSSKVGEGTTFKVYLPRLDETLLHAITKRVSRPLISTGHDGMVLLVEDEEIVRDVAREVLEDLGFRVIACSNGEDALKASRAIADTIDLLVTDVVMPGVDGRELADQLSAEREGIIVLFTSGYSREVIASHGVLDEGLSFLPKPYTPEELGRKVEEVLNL